MLLTESVFVGSIPSFLDAADLAEFRSAMDEVEARMLQGELTADNRAHSVHSIEGMSTREAMRVYEPLGRDEATDLPDAAVAVLRRAAERNLPVLRTMLPSVREMGYWTLVSYTTGQFITPHIDLSDNDLDPEHPKVAGLSICLSEPADYEGGEFFVETTCDPEQWLPPTDDAPARVRPGCDDSSEWYRTQPRTRWTARPAAGDALLYGSQLTHGTEPVRSGRVVKVIGFLF